MTTIVAVRTSDHIVIGADTLLTQGDTRLSDDYNRAEKIFRIGNSCIGLAGSVAHYTALLQALRQLGDECQLHDTEAVFNTFTKAHRKLKDDFFLNPKKQHDDPYESNHISAMVANGSGIYGLYAHREVIPFARFWSNGSGRPYALGAMHQAWNAGLQHAQGPDAETVARAGLSAGMEFDRASGGRAKLFRFTANTDLPPEPLE